MRGSKGAVWAVGLALLLAGCGGDASEPESETLGKDTGIRYDKSRVPTVRNMACDRKRGSVRYGLSAHKDDSLPAHGGKDDSEDYVCHGPDRISLAVEGRTVAVPHIAAEYDLYGAVPDPLKTVTSVYGKSLAEDDERTLVGEAVTVTTRTAAITCQQNVWETFPMTTCLWANHGAVGAVDFFPPAGRHPEISEAVARTKELIATGLVESPR
ncbi:hypothetical protein [Streptomyces xanthophaeus]|uniref:hypothetical protein n=1 Tax=Streptomyces xanthophaeus TaxID=67385 RepID=UPI00264A3F2D|nr:hypothetical protein [Streptomyces xanthophaeus]WKD31432.1 hypothetical protein KO717_05330 [Streptomyces xanthophaeus]